VRSLNPDEAEAWARVTATIRPLSRDRIDELNVAQPVEPSVQSETGTTIRLSTASSPKPKLPTKSEPGRTLDGTWDRRLRSGTVQPDRVLDLHGLTLDSAWTAIERALEQSIERGDRVLLLITGHHRPGTAPVQRGKIRAAVHDWLAASRHAARIAAVRGAHPRHGGGGSLYIVLRRR
jgi:DNA-nicking Smr family endonuclease